MFNLELNKVKNLIVLKLEGFVENEKVAEYANECKKAITTLKPGFTMITDISGLKPGTQESLWVVREIMELINKSQPGKIIRIEGNELAKNQFERAWKNAHISYQVIKVKSYKEAMAEVKRV